MKKTIITLLATAAMAAPAFAANNAANQPQQPATQQQERQANQQQSRAQQQNTHQQQQSQAEPQNGNRAAIAPRSLGRTEVRKMQSALNKDGFKAGRPDGKFGPKTRHAVQAFDQKKGIQSNNGQLTEQTLAELGVSSNQSQQQNENQQQPSGSGQ